MDILTVNDATSWRIENSGLRVIEIEGIILPGTPIAASIPVTSLLGRVESSPLQVVSLEAIDPSATGREQEGR